MDEQSLLRKIIDKFRSSDKPQTSTDVLDYLDDLKQKKGMIIEPSQLVGAGILDEHKVHPYSKYRTEELSDALLQGHKDKPFIYEATRGELIKNLGDDFKDTAGLFDPQGNQIIVANQNPFDSADTLRHEVEHYKDFKKSPIEFNKTSDMKNFHVKDKMFDITDDIVGEYNDLFKNMSSEEVAKKLSEIDPEEAIQHRLNALKKVKNDPNLFNLLSENDHYINKRMPLMDEMRRIMHLVPKAGRKLLGPAGLALGVASGIESAQAGDYPQAIADIEPTGLAQLGLWGKDLLKQNIEEATKNPELNEPIYPTPTRKWKILKK